MQKTVIAIIITAIVVGGGVYFWQQQKVEKPTVSVVNTQNEQKLPSVQPTNTVKPTPSNEVQNTQPKQKASPQFDTMDQYVSFLSNPEIASQYKTTKPAGFEVLKFGGQGEGVNLAPDGVSVGIFVFAKNNWDVGNMNDVNTFYLEFVTPSPCWDEENCNEPENVTYYGPFQGKLKLLVQ